jgi:transcription-repair coupling factor (superfamily II helicase)
MGIIDRIDGRLDRPGAAIIDEVATGYEGFVLAGLASGKDRNQPLIFVARDGQRIPALAEILRFAAPGLPVLELPAWDCLPYDRVSPGSDAAARRLSASLSAPTPCSSACRRQTSSPRRSSQRAPATAST